MKRCDTISPAEGGYHGGYHYIMGLSRRLVKKGDKSFQYVSTNCSEFGVGVLGRGDCEFSSPYV